MRKLTQHDLHELINYDPATGVISRIRPTTTRQYVDQVEDKAYITFYDDNYSTLRIVWQYINGGDYTDKTIIQIDGDTSNFMYSNLIMDGMFNKEVLTPELLRKFISYDRTTGLLSWKLRGSRSAKVNDPIGFTTGKKPDGGYLGLHLFGKIYASHRIAWFHYYGEWPTHHIDHIDHDRTNNAISNLRLADVEINSKNKSLYQSNRTGYPGVKPHRDRWSACIGGSTDRIHLGIYDTIEEAIAAKKAGERVLNYHNNHGKPNDYPEREYTAS